MANETAISGNCDTRFEAVREAFAENFASRGELGAAVAVVVDGRPVVDLWGGWMDAARTRPWRPDSLVAVWSLGKAMASIALHRLAERGQVDLDAPVARYWPEFAQAGKERLPLRYLLTHQAGLTAVREPLPPGANLTSWSTMTDALARQAPWWEPGTGHGYHVNTHGFLVGEVIRRVDGRSIGRYVREEIAEPFGLDFHIGLGPGHDDRTADWVAHQPEPGEASRRPWLERDPAELDGIDLMRVLAYRNPPPLPDGQGDINTRMWRAAEFPSTNPHSNARALARLFGILATGGRADGRTLLEPGTIERARQVEADGEDLVLGRPTRFGLGFQLTMPGVREIGPNPNTFGHYGNGAILGFADPDAGIGFGYTCNQAGRSWRDPRNIALIDAVYASL